MISFFIAIGVLALLLLQGWWIGRMFLPGIDRLLAISLAPIFFALTNVLLVAVLTLSGQPLSPLTFALGHILIALLAWGAQRFRSAAPAHIPRDAPAIMLTPFLRTLLMIVLSVVMFFSTIFTLFLPTHAIDSLTNWTHRAQVSFVDQSMAFDKTERRGVAKPQYPFLLHALQIAANQGQPSWNDRLANIATGVLSLGSFAAFFLLLKRLRGRDTALLTLTAIAAMPLMSIHLAQGYADIHLVEFGLLGLVSLGLWRRSHDKRWVQFSALCIAGMIWTKTDGIVIGYAPWAITAALLGWRLLTWKQLCMVLVLPGALFLPMPLILWQQGLSFTPHESDLTIGWHPEAWPALMDALFHGGSFGIAVYLLIGVLPLLIFLGWKRDERIDRPQLLLLLWGGLALAGVLFVYLWTPNVTFLLNAQSFFRQMLAPLALLLAACAIIYKGNTERVPAGSFGETPGQERS